VKFHIPPEYNREGRRQFWFVSDCRGAEVINGVLTAAVMIGPIALITPAPI